MSAKLMRQTADLLEKLAEAFDSEERQQAEKVTQERQKTAQELRDKIAQVTGEEIAPATVERLVASGQDVTALFSKLAGHNTLGGEPDAMGTVGNPQDVNSAPRATREKTASEDADGRFYNWIMN